MSCIQGDQEEVEERCNEKRKATLAESILAVGNRVVCSAGSGRRGCIDQLFICFFLIFGETIFAKEFVPIL